MNDLKTYQDTIWGVSEIIGTSEEMLTGLDRKDLYLPVLNQIKLEKRKREWLAVRLLLKKLLGEEKEIGYDDMGKPCFIDQSYHLSISHTKGYVAVILNPAHWVGIDIEQISDQVLRLKKRFLSPDEEKAISPKGELIHILLHWSAKETMFKAMGVNEVIFNEHLYINSFEPELGVLSSFHSSENRTPQKTEFLIRYIVNSEYVLTFTEI